MLLGLRSLQRRQTRQKKTRGAEQAKETDRSMVSLSLPILLLLLELSLELLLLLLFPFSLSLLLFSLL